MTQYSNLMEVRNHFKNKELFLFSSLVILLVFVLSGFPVNIFLHINLFILIFIWIRKRKLSFSKSEFWERVLSIPMIYGFILTSAHLNYSNMISVLGIIILLLLYLIRGIQKLTKREVFTSIEFFLVFFLLLGYFLRIMIYPGSGVLRVFSTMLLQIYYLSIGIHFAISIYNQNEKILSIFSVILCGILCIYLNAILFDTMFWPCNMILFWFAVISSLVVLPVILLKLFKKNNLSEEISFFMGKLFKRYVLISSISLFFAVASPHQYLRFVHGNRPQFIEAYYNCWILDTDKKSQKNYCDEFESLDRLIRAGLYYQGMSDAALEEVKKINDAQK